MKKILSLIFVLIIIISSVTLSSCDDKEIQHNNGDEIEKLADKTPYQAYKESFDHISTATSFEMLITTNYVMKYLDNVDSNVKLESYKTDGVTAYYSSKYDNEIVEERWYVDGVMYSVQDGNKKKTQVSAESFKKDYSMDIARYVISLEESSFSDSKFVFEDGVYYITLELMQDKYIAYMGMNTSSSGLCKIGFDSQGNIISLKVSGVYTSHGGVDIETEQTVEFKNIGSTSAKSAPADKDSFSAVLAE